MPKPRQSIGSSDLRESICVSLTIFESNGGVTSTNILNAKLLP